MVEPKRERAEGPGAALSDAEVVRRVVAGETALFEVLMRRYNQRIYRAVRAILGSDAEAEDAMQAAFVLREIEQLSTAESAAALDISQEALKVRLHRARLALRDTLFEKMGGAAAGAFTFGNARCDRVVAAVLQRVGA